jgi:hypothetical protein
LKEQSKPVTKREELDLYDFGPKIEEKFVSTPTHPSKNRSFSYFLAQRNASTIDHDTDNDQSIGT